MARSNGAKCCTPHRRGRSRLRRSGSGDAQAEERAHFSGSSIGGRVTILATLRTMPRSGRWVASATRSQQRLLGVKVCTLEPGGMRTNYVVVKLANVEDVPKRLILGIAAVMYVKQVEAARAEEAAKYREMTISTPSVHCIQLWRSAAALGNHVTIQRTLALASPLLSV